MKYKIKITKSNVEDYQCRASIYSEMLDGKYSYETSGWGNTKEEAIERAKKSYEELYKEDEVLETINLDTLD